MERGVWRTCSRALVGALFLAGALSLWQVAVPARVVAAQSDLTFISNSTWTADPTKGRVHVLAVVTATSHTVDTGNRRYFYDQVQLTLPPSSSAFEATSGANQPLPVTVVSASSSSVIVEVGLGQRLYSGQSGAVDLKFDLLDSGGSTDRDLRIGHNLMSFPVWAFGSPSTPGSSVTAIFPSDFTVQEEYGGLTRAVFGSGEVVFSSGVIADSTEFNAWFTAVQPVPPGDFRVRSITIGPLSVALRYWVDDVGWADQVERVLRAGYPVLRDMIGLGDPIGTTLTVEEASTQEIGGYSGAYNPASGQVLISYFADPFVILHEAAHMWLNSDLVSDRWIQEGFASYYAQQAVDVLGFTDHAPVLTDRMLQASVPLNDWLNAGEPGSETDAYGYGASLQVAQQIAGLAGQDGLSTVWRAARSGRAAYQPLHGAQGEMLGGGSVDWRRLLDLLEQTTDRSYVPIWRTWIVDPSQASLLQQRDTTLAAYADAETVAGSWNLPPEIRRSLDTWQYNQATAFVAQARGLLSQRDQIVIAAGNEQTAPPPTLKTAFEHAGIIVASEEATNELAVLNELSAARQARTISGGAARDVGLLGADPQADLASARDAFAKGELPQAMDLATSARVAWQSANGAGQMRIFGSLCVLVGGLLLLAVFIWGRRSVLAGQMTVVGVAVASGAGSAGGAVSTGRAGSAGGAVSAGRAGAGGAGRAGRAGAGQPPTRPQAQSKAAAGAAGVSTAGATVAATAASTAASIAATDATGDALDSGPSNGHGRPGSNGDRPAAVDDGATSSDESAYDLLQRGHALLRERHNAQAAVVLERAARLEQRKGSILEALGRAYFNSGQHARAAETFEALVEIDPSAHYGHFALGLSFARLGRAQEAMTHLRMAAALDPASETYRRALEKMDSAKL